jgi:homocitrate synthase NifV
LNKKLAQTLIINDTTLRDGEQAPGVAFSHPEKLEIAKLLDEVGVHQIEAGFPAIGIDERLTFRAIARLKLKAQIIAWSRATINDIQDCLAAEAGAISISIPASDIMLRCKLGWERDQALKQAQMTVKYAQQRQFGHIYVGAEDASRADPDFLVRLAQTAQAAGAERLRIADTLGILDPFKTYKLIKKLVSTVPDFDIEIHAHNDFGLATANSLAAVKAGAKSVSTTVCGIGERAGNAAMEELVMALKYQSGIVLPLKTRCFKTLAEKVSRAAQREIPVWKPIVGDAVFTHESGIHVDALLKNPQTYQLFQPEEVGQNRQYIIGKSSGSAGLIHQLEQAGISLSPLEAKLLMPFIRRKATQLKRALKDTEIVELYYQFQSAPAGV